MTPDGFIEAVLGILTNYRGNRITKEQAAYEITILAFDYPSYPSEDHP
jgi:hypothetical protein